MATPEDLPLQKYLQLQVKADREVLKLLRSFRRDVEQQLKAIAGSGPGATIRREQLRLAQHAIDDSINSTWLNLRDTIERNSLVAARDAVLVNGEFDRVLLAAGLSGAERDALLRSNVAQAQQAVRHALNRYFDETGAQRIPLSEKVYRSRELVKGEVDRLVESALARGLSAKEFAREVMPFINPNTPGGIRYAAMRLSRTEINNAFHYAQTRDNAAKPWVNGQKWHLSGSHPKPDECNEYADENKFNLGKGVFPAGNVPAKPHPHCLCFVTPETDSEEEWLRKFQSGEYNDYLDSRMPVGLPEKKVSAVKPKPKAKPKTVQKKEPVAQGKSAPAKSLAERLKQGEKSTKKLSGGASAKTELATLEDGSKIVKKTVSARNKIRPAQDQLDAEELAAKYGRRLDLDAPDVVRTGKQTVAMEYKEGQTADAILSKLNNDIYKGKKTDADLAKFRAELGASDDGLRTALFDYVILNTDRNLGNFIVHPNGNLSLIDHGMAFIEDSDRARQYAIQTNQFIRIIDGTPFDPQSPRSTLTASNAYSKADIDFMRRALEDVRADFERLNRMGWYNEASRRLDELERLAKGKGNLFRD